MPELLRHLRDGFPVQDVIAIMLGNRLLDGLLKSEQSFFTFVE